MRDHGIGLRAQILVALGVGFAASVILLGLATTRLGARALEADRARVATRTANALLVGVDERDDRAIGESLDAIVGDTIVGAEITIGDRTIERGEQAGAQIETSRGGARARLWIAEARGSLPGLLFLYVGMTAAAILLLTYLLLTRAIVRPVEDLTRASERIARTGTREVRVPVHGAAEIARLAVSFNEMQGHLARERTALEERLGELERTTAELASAQSSLVRSEKMASVGRLAAGVAHEIGNPLSAILGLVELVKDGDLPPEQQREFLARVTKETERIHRIIRDLLDFARPSPNDAPSSCDPIEVVEDAVRLVGPQKDLRQVTIERRIPDECPRVRGEAARLEQVVLNLLLNAADAIAGEGTIRIEIDVEDREVVLSVIDSGAGISPEVRDSLFEPFVTTKPPGSGTGLGLAVCQSIVEDAGGRIDADDAPEGGARFTVRLPIAQ
jgi:two-component system NtrC family sensor kinase